MGVNADPSGFCSLSLVAKAPAPLREGSGPRANLLTDPSLNTVARIIAAARHVPIAEREGFLSARPEVVEDRIVLEAGEYRYVVLPGGLVWRRELRGVLRGALFREGVDVARYDRKDARGRWR